MAEALATTNGDHPAVTLEEIEALHDAASAGEPAALARFVRLVDRDPQNWQAIGDLGAEIRTQLLRSAAGGDAVRYEAVKRVTAALVEELAPSGTPALERLLVERIVTAHLAVTLAEAAADRAHRDPEVRMEACDYYLRRLDGAHRRFVSSVKALALIRRLNVPSAVAQSAVIIKTERCIVEGAPTSPPVLEAQGDER